MLCPTTCTASESLTSVPQGGLKGRASGRAAGLAAVGAVPGEESGLCVLNVESCCAAAPRALRSGELSACLLTADRRDPAAA